MMIYKWSSTQFSLTFSESTGACALRFLLSSLETVYVMIFEWSGTQFSLTFSESTGAVRADESTGHLWKHFR